MPEKQNRPTFDELMFPKPQNRQEAKELRAPKGAAKFQDSKLGLILIWTFDIIMIAAIAVAAAYITALFSL